MKRLPPIFARHRFTIPRDMQPGVVFCMTRDMEQEAEAMADLNDNQDIANEHFGRWWIEYPFCGILASVVGERSYGLQYFGRKGRGPDAPFVFCDDAMSLDHVWRDLNDAQKITAGLYMKASISLHLHTARERDVSVNTLTRNKPRAWIRQGDTLKFAPLDSLASAAGQRRQRGYERPAEASGIRMREHDVRGHWRTYASGVRVWVRPHKRGDGDLGRVERVIG